MWREAVVWLSATLALSCGARSALEVEEIGAESQGGMGGAGGHLAGGAGPSCEPPREALPLASFEQAPTSVDVYAGFVYWLAGNEVRRVSRCGGAPTTLAQTPAETGNNLSVTSAGVFWQTSKAVRRVAHSGGDITVLSTGGEIWGLHVDAAAAYYYVRPTTSPGGIFRVPIIGGSPVALWTSSLSPGYVGPLVGDSDFLYHFGGGTSSPSGPLRRVAKDGSTAVELTHSAIPSSVVVAEALYATFMQGVNEIRRIDVGDGSTNVVKANQPTPRAVTTDGEYLYWATSKSGEEGRLVRQSKPPASGPVPPPNGDIEVLVDGLSDARGLHVDEDAIYWTDRGAGMVGWRAKP